MHNYITIDGGTTNTRVSLVCENKIVDTIKSNIGAKMGIENNKLLKNTVKKGIDEIIRKNNLTQGDVTAILASGMITSELGLFALEHIMAPAGIKELAENISTVMLEDVCEIPISFVRGVKKGTSFKNTDMMRGEETELIGLLEEGSAESIYLLMGSHTKLIKTDAYGRIFDFSTMMTGEMVAAITQNTILKSAVSLENNQADTEYLIKGYEYCRENGMNEALFKVRILKNLFGEKDVQTYSFFMGILLSGEIDYIRNSGIKNVVVSGNKPLKYALSKALSAFDDLDVKTISDELSEQCVSKGLVKIYEYNI